MFRRAKEEGGQKQTPTVNFKFKEKVQPSSRRIVYPDVVAAQKKTVMLPVVPKKVMLPVVPKQKQISTTVQPLLQMVPKQSLRQLSKPVPRLKIVNPGEVAHPNNSDLFTVVPKRKQLTTEVASASQQVGHLVPSSRKSAIVPIAQSVRSVYNKSCPNCRCRRSGEEAVSYTHLTLPTKA